MAQINFSTEKKIMDLENRLLVAKGEGEGVVEMDEDDQKVKKLQLQKTTHAEKFLYTLHLPGTDLNQL